jgi:hypothetical protein
VYGSIYNTVDGFTMLIASFYFKYFSRNWIYLHIFFLALSAIATFIATYLPESPKFLISKGHFEKARISFN